MSARSLDRLAALPLSYSEVGATAGTMPNGYRLVTAERRLGTGSRCFDAAADRLMSWQMHRRAGLRVEADGVVAVNVVAMLAIRLGPWRIKAPVRVVEVVNEPALRGFAYGTLPGHPESGEERFLIHLDRDGGVHAEIRAFSRPARLLTRVGGPVARRMQDTVTNRYLIALTPRPSGSSG